MSVVGRSWRVCVWLLLACVPASSAVAQTRTATVSQWDLFAATGGSDPNLEVRTSATQNITAAALDVLGAAGSVNSVWVAAQRPLIRLGRIDPSTNTHTEWRLLNDRNGESGVTPALAISPASSSSAAYGDLWMSIAGTPAFVLKLRGTNTFRKFVVAAPVVLSPFSITAHTDGNAYVAVPESNYYGGLIVQVPRTAPDGSLFLSAWASTAIQPRDVAVDSSGRIWFTNAANNTLARLDRSTRVATEWPLAGTGPSGLYFSDSQVCVVSQGQLTVLSGEVECINPGTNERTRFTRSAPPAGFLDYPQQVAASRHGELFITEQRANAVLFVGQQAYTGSEKTTVTPTSRTLSSISIEVFVADEQVLPVTFQTAPVSEDLRATDIGNGFVRFGLPAVPQTDLETLDRYPQPGAITQVINDVNVGRGTVIVADSFDGPIGAYRGARVSMFDLLPERPVTSASETSLAFSATVGDASATPPTREVTITNTGDGTLEWTATPSEPWIRVLPASDTSTGNPTTLSVAVDVPTSGGELSGAITITGPGADPIAIDVLFTVADRPAEMSLDTATLTFTAKRGGPAPVAQVVNLTNSGGENLVWSRGALPSWLTVSPTSGTLAPGATAALSFAVSLGGLDRGSYPATVTISAPNASNPSASITVSLNVTAPTIGLNPSSLTLTADQGATATQVVEVANTGDAPLTFTPIASVPWLAVAPAGSTTIPPGGSATLTMTAGNSTLAAGTYDGSITIADSGATNGPQTIAVTLSVRAAGVLTLAPPSVAVTAAKGGSVPAQAITVGNSGGADLSYSAVVSTGSAWLSIGGGADGTIAPNGSGALTLSLNVAGLDFGTHVGSVQITATGAGNSSQNVTVSVEIRDTSAPVLTLPSAMNVEAAGPSGAMVTYSASASDDSGTSPTVTCTPASGGTFALGTATVTCSATDAAGNRATDSFTVTVADRTGPTLTVPSNLVREASGPLGATVTFAVTAVDAVDATPTVSCTPSSGSTFGLGTRVVTCTATDDASNAASRSFTVTVLDTTAPTLSLPANMTVMGTSASGAAVSYTATATDLVSGSVPVVCNPASGATFPIGTTTVTCSATDAAGRSASGVFTVTVLSPTSFSSSPSSLYFKTGRLAYCNGVAVGPNWKDQGLVMTNTGGATLTYSAATATSWIRVTPSSGSLAPGASTTLTVSVDLSGLGRGIYSGSLTITGNGSVSQNVPVTLEIGNALPTLCLTPTNTPFGTVKAGKTSATKYFDVLNVGDDPLGSWTAARMATSGTVNMSATSGTGPKTIAISVKTTTKRGTQSGTITINAPGAVQSGQTVNLTWTVQ